MNILTTLNVRKIILSTLALFVLSVNTAKAVTIEVQNNNDSSVGSLRQAVIDAADLDTIRFNSSLIASGSNTINLISEIAFSKNLVFKGLYNSTDTLYISGSNTNRIFNITNTVKTIIDSMVFINGNAGIDNGGALSIAGVDTVFVSNSTINNSSSASGGGVDVRSNLTGPSQILLDINNSIITNNSAVNNGGGVYLGGSNIILNINNSIINNNSSIDQGGGIYSFEFNDGFVTINNSSINNNSVSGGNGGGLYLQSLYTNFYTTITNSTIDNNTASGSGGGIFSFPKAISSIVLNSTTISNNTANQAGGIHSGNYSSGASQSLITLTNSTISGNHATDDLGGIASMAQIVSFIATNSTISGNSTATSFNKCGGIYVFGVGTSSLEFTSSIVSTSIGDNIKHIVVDGGGSFIPSPDPIISGGYNIFSNAPSGANQTGDLTNVSAMDLNLQSLANYGGSVLTMQPGTGSVAIDAGNPSDASDAQNAPISGIRDIGAAESGNSIILVSSITVQDQAGVSIITTQGGTLQMEAAVLPLNADDGTYVWSVTNGTGSATIDANGLLTAITDGTVEVTATANDASGEVGTTTITISNQSLSVHENNLSSQISIYPNPVKNELFIKLNNLKVTKMSIFDYSGRLVKSINENVNSINVSDLQQGIYFLKVSTENGESIKRFKKE